MALLDVRYGLHKTMTADGVLLLSSFPAPCSTFYMPVNYWPTTTNLMPLTPLTPCVTPVSAQSYCSYDSNFPPLTGSSTSDSGTSSCNKSNTIFSFPSSKTSDKSSLDLLSINNGVKDVGFPDFTPLPFPMPGWTSFPYGLERFWMRAFMCLFMDYYVQGYLWTLTPTDKPPKDDDKGFPWHCFIQIAKVRFHCPKRHGWTTMQGRAAFWYRIVYTKPGLGNFVRGEVVFKLYGQKCETCCSGNYETALWYPEEIANAIWNLYFKIGQKLFGLPGFGVVRGLRGGKPLRSHKPDLCQACVDGICRVSSRSLKKK